MKKAFMVGCLLILAAVPTAFAQGGLKLGAGAFAGLSYPILQDDQANGTEFGFRGRLGRRLDSSS